MLAKIQIDLIDNNNDMIIIEKFEEILNIE
jgi:hypothetical protein